MLAHEFTRERYSTCVTGSSKSSHAEETLGLKGPTCHVSVASRFIQASVYDFEVSNIRNMDIYIYIYIYIHMGDNHGTVLGLNDGGIKTFFKKVMTL